MVVYLIAKNFGVNNQTSDGSTPLHLAAKGNHHGHPKIVQVLLEYGGGSIFLDVFLLQRPKYTK